MENNMVMVFYNFTQTHKKFEKFAVFASKASSILFFCIYFSIAIYLFIQQSSGFILHIAVPASTLTANILLRKIIHRPRPYLKLNLSAKYAVKKSSSFPSNHAVCAGIIAFSCIFVSPNYGIFVFFLAIFTGMLRIFLGLHYPTDVMAGYILSGVATAIGYHLIPSLFYTL